MMVTKLLLVAGGGAIGSVLRYLVSGVSSNMAFGAVFPLGTLIVNVTGCFLIGFLAYLIGDRGLFAAETRAFLMVGILGGFTTFSSFGYETLNLLRDGEMRLALISVAGNLLLGLCAVLLGNSLAHVLWR